MIIRNLGITDYERTLARMQEFTQKRGKNTEDELWITSHNAVFTHGINSSDDNVIVPNNIKIVKTDRGGKITYHDKEQVIIYTLLDLKTLHIGVKKLVEIIENSVIELLKNYNISAHTIENAHGVYVDNAKISALGLKIKNGKTYHGLSLNIDMDLTPFSYINPCGYQGLKVCNMQNFVDEALDFNIVATELSEIVVKLLHTNYAK